MNLIGQSPVICLSYTGLCRGEALFRFFTFDSHTFQIGHFCFSHFCLGIDHPQLTFDWNSSASLCFDLTYFCFDSVLLHLVQSHTL